MINESKPTTTITNSTKVDIQETWDSNTTTWDTETRTWDEMLSIIDNSPKVTSTITNISKPV